MLTRALLRDTVETSDLFWSVDVASSGMSTHEHVLVMINMGRGK